MDNLSKNRERRSNAGSRMAAMLDKEEEEDFYKNTYGGFFEEDNDNEYQSEDSESDNVDSDFDIDEQDEVIDFEDDEDKKRTRGRVITKAYKEPKRKTENVGPRTTKRLKVLKTYKDYDEEDEEEEEQNEKLVEGNENLMTSSNSHKEKKSLRTSTKLKSKATQKRTKLALENKKRKRIKVDHIELTQEDLLKEAKETEKINIKSLEKYEKLELEKSRKNKSNRKMIVGPIIKYHSMTMPLISDLNKPETINGKCSRNFITFTDEEVFNKYFHHMENKDLIIKRSKICSISKLPARYFDPVTNLPYSSTFSFRTLREAYYKQLEMLDENSKTDEIKNFIQYRKNRQNVLNTIIKSETSFLSLDNTNSDNSNSGPGMENSKTEAIDFKNNIFNGNSLKQNQIKIIVPN